MEKRLKIDRSKWHKPSYTGHYDEESVFYEGIRIRCRKCEQSFVFTEQAQKDAFETEQRYPGWSPSLCLSCESNLELINQNLKSFEDIWERNRDQAQLDSEFLENWLAQLKEARKHSSRFDESRIRMVIKAIRNL